MNPFAVKAKPPLYQRIARREGVRHGTALLVATTAGSAALFLFHFLASRRLGVENYGLLASLLASVALISFTASVGTSIVARFGAQYQATGEAGKMRRLNDFVLWVSIGIFAVGIAIAAVFRAQFAAFFRVEGSWSLSLTVVLTALGVVLALARGVQQGAQRFTALSVSQIIEYFGKAALGAIAVFAGLGVVGVLVGQIVASIAAASYTLGDTHKRFTVAAERLRLDPRKLLKACAGIAGAYVALAVLINVDVVLAKHYLSAREAGLYAVATLPGRALASIMFILPTMLLPKAAARASAGQPSHGLLRAAFGASAAAWLCALVAFYSVPVPIVYLIAGGAYTQAAPLVFLYGCSAAIFAFVSVVVSYRAGHGNFGFVLPLLIVVSAELIAIANFHKSAAEIIRVLIAANTLALVVSLYRMTMQAQPQDENARAS